MTDFEPSVKSIRRFYLLKAVEAYRIGDYALSTAWSAKQEAELGTSLPDDFPHKSDLAAWNYLAVEDLDGANIEELQLLGLSSKQAEAVFAALAPLI